ncbi:hypothetical protein QUA99_31945 [Microcoleus sp. F10-B2]
MVQDFLSLNFLIYRKNSCMSNYSRRNVITVATLAMEANCISGRSIMRSDNIDVFELKREINKSALDKSMSGVKNFSEFGAKGDGVSDNSEAWKKVAIWASGRSFSGNSPKLLISPGRYVSFEMPNLAIDRFHMQFDGEVWLINNGRDHSFILDGGSAGDGVYGMVITGWPQIYGNKNSKNGIFARGIFNSHLQFNCRGAGSDGVGFYGAWLVDNKIEFIMTSVEGGLYNAPKCGILLTTRNVNEDSSYNNIEIKISGVDVGVALYSSLGNSIYGGSIQNCIVGMQLYEGAWDNKIWATDFEGNETDIIDSSKRLYLNGCDLNGLSHFIDGSSGAKIFGGRVEKIKVDSHVSNILISGVGFNRTGSGYYQNSSSTTRLRDVFDISGGNYLDEKQLTN